jgi:hypothetical protein
MLDPLGGRAKRVDLNGALRLAVDCGWGKVHGRAMRRWTVLTEPKRTGMPTKREVSPFRANAVAPQLYSLAREPLTQVQNTLCIENGRRDIHKWVGIEYSGWEGLSVGNRLA